MKMNVSFRGTLVAMEETKSKDGHNSYYKCAVLQGAECNTVSCSKEVFESRPEVYKNYDFGLAIGEYDGKATYRIISINDIPSAVGSSAPPKYSGK